MCGKTSDKRRIIMLRCLCPAVVIEYAVNWPFYTTCVRPVSASLAQPSEAQYSGAERRSYRCMRHILYGRGNARADACRWMHAPHPFCGNGELAHVLYRTHPVQKCQLGGHHDLKYVACSTDSDAFSDHGWVGAHEIHVSLQLLNIHEFTSLSLPLWW